MSTNKKILLGASLIPIAIVMKKGGFYFAWGSAAETARRLSDGS